MWSLAADCGKLSIEIKDSVLYRVASLCPG